MLATIVNELHLVLSLQRSKKKRSGIDERLGNQQATTPHRPMLLEAQRRKYDSVWHSANGSATWPLSTLEATWEVQTCVQRLPLSEPFNLTLFQGCELRNTCNSFTVITSAVYERNNANAGRVA